MDNTTLFGISLYNGKYSDFFLKIQNPESKTLVFTPNPEIFVRANRDEEFMNILKKATYNVPDGNGLYVGYMMLEGRSFFRAAFETFFMKKAVREKYGELIKGSDLTRDILTTSLIPILEKEGKKEGSKDSPLSESEREGGRRKRKILIIDKKITEPRNDLERKKQELQKNMKSRLEEKYPFVQIYGVFAEETSPKEIAQIIVDNQIEYILSCIGMKAQEKLLGDIFDILPDDQKVVGLGVGASIDFLMGIQKRAPQIFQRLGLEWLYRLITQPRIRAKRIYDAVVEFPRMVKNGK